MLLSNEFSFEGGHSRNFSCCAIIRRSSESAWY